MKPAVLNASPVIVLARAGFLDLVPGTVAVLDDRAARRSASTLQIPVVGTLGLLLAARRNGLLDSLEKAIERVKACGLFVDPATCAKVIAMGREASDTSAP